MSTCLTNSGIENPIVIDKDKPSPEKTAAVPRKRQRTGKRDRKAEILHQLSSISKDGSLRVQELLRSSKKIVVISRAGISANTGCRLNLT